MDKQPSVYRSRLTGGCFFIVLAYLCISLTSAPASAKTVLYKKVDKDGRVILTDKPIPGAEPITVDTTKNVIQTVKPKPRDSENSTDEDDDLEDIFQYERLAIATPLANHAVRANDGNVQVRASIKPNLRPNHSLQVLLDGQPAGSRQKIPYFSLNQVIRGNHVIEVIVINDDNNETIQSSDPVSFNVLKASIMQQKKKRRKQGR